MTERTQVVDTFWRFAAERQRIFYCRFQGASPPWTADPVLAGFRFCNVYRASDRVSQYLIREVIYDGVSRKPEDILLRIVLFRHFSRPDTWAELDSAVGGVSVRTFDEEGYGRVLDAIRTRHPIYTSAFILCAGTSFGYATKHRNHLALVGKMIADGLGRRVAQARSMAEVFNGLIAYPLIGPFMGYQLAVDINYSELTNFSENDFTVAGPGALRGIAKVFSDTGSTSPEKLILRMVEMQEEAFQSRGLTFCGLFGRRLHAIDVQNLFCEVDKYCRVAFPELQSNRTRIKHRFAGNPAPIRYFYPPKWGIDVSALDRMFTANNRGGKGKRGSRRTDPGSLNCEVPQIVDR